MPVVPKYQEKTKARALRGGESSVRIPSGAFGDASGLIPLAQGFDEASDRLATIGLDIKKREDTRAAKDAYLRFKQEITQNLYGDKDRGITGMLDRHGDQSKGIVEDAHKFIEKARERAGRGLANSTQADLFSRFADRSQAAYLEKTYAHQSKELHALEVNQTKALIDSSVQDLMRATPEEWGDREQELKGHIRTFAKISGLVKEETEQLFTDHISTARVNQVTGLIAREEYQAAREYLSQHAEEMTPKAVVGLEAKIVDAERVREAYDIAYTVSREMGGQPLSQQQDEIRKLSSNPEVELASMSFHRSLYDTAQQQYKESLIYTENQFRAAAAGAESPKQLYQVWQRANSISDPKTKKVALVAVKEGGKSPAVSAPDALKSARKDIARGISKEELEAKYWKKVSAGDLKELAAQLGDINGQRVNTFMLRLSQKIKEDIPSKSTEAFIDQMEQFVASYKAENNRYPTDKELSDHKKFLTQEVVYDSGEGFFNLEDSIQGYLLNTVAPEDWNIPEVEDALTSRGWSPGMRNYEAVRQRAYQLYFRTKGRK